MGVNEASEGHNIPAALSATVEHHNFTSERPLENGPWTLLGPLKAYFTTTEGGVAVDDDMRALDANGQAIPGLRCVGQNGLGGMILWGHGRHIAWAMTSGRLAGEAVLREMGSGTRTTG